MTAAVHVPVKSRAFFCIDLSSIMSTYKVPRAVIRLQPFPYQGCIHIRPTRSHTMIEDTINPHTKRIAQSPVAHDDLNKVTPVVEKGLALINLYYGWWLEDDCIWTW